MMLTMRFSAIQTQPVCVKDGRNYATRYKRTFARWRINGGLSQKAEEIQCFADTNDTQKFYKALKTIYGLTQHAVHPVKYKDGTKVMKDHEGILSRWAEHLKELLNCVNPTDPTLVDLIPQLLIIPQLDRSPAFYEVEVAIKGLKNNKSAGPDGIPAEVFKHGGNHLTHRLHQFIHRAWTTGKLPQQWKDATVVTIYTKRKGTDKSVAIVVAFPCCRWLEKFLHVLCSSGFSAKLSTSSYLSFSVVFAMDVVPLI